MCVLRQGSRLNIGFVGCILGKTLQGLQSVQVGQCKGTAVCLAAVILTVGEENINQHFLHITDDPRPASLPEDSEEERGAEGLVDADPRACRIDC